MITVREATLDDVDQIRDVFQAEYGDRYAYPQYYDRDALARLVYADGSLLLVAADAESGRVAGTASVVFSVAAHNDLVGEFGRLVVHPGFRGRGIGKQLMRARLDRVRQRLHVGIVENRTAHEISQRISQHSGFVNVGFLPMKLLIERRESIALFAQYFGDALKLRRNNPRIVPEAAELAAVALEHCGLPADAIIDEVSAPFPHEDEFELDELKTEGYASLLRIERGRLRNRDIFGPVRLHYGLFHLKARHSHYLIARRQNVVMGGVGFMIDEVEKVVRIFELISVDDGPVHFLLAALVRKCQDELDVEYVEVDVSAYSPRMQRTLLETGFLPVGYVPANVFHEVERLDAIKMARLMVPFNVDRSQLSEITRPIAEVVIRSFVERKVPSRIARAAERNPLFTGLSNAQRKQLLSITEAGTFEPGQVLYRRGDRDGTMHLLLEGEVDVFGEDGVPIGRIACGQCVGETSLLYSPQVAPPHSVDALAKTHVESAMFRSEAFHALVRRRPEIAAIVYRNLAADVSSKLKQKTTHPH